MIVSNNLREVLKDDTGGLERNFDVLGGIVDPVNNLFNVGLKHVELVAVSDGRLQEDTHGVG